MNCENKVTTFTVQSPIEGSIYGSDIPVQFSITYRNADDWFLLNSTIVKYYLDGQLISQQQIPESYSSDEPSRIYNAPLPTGGGLVLNNLAQGEHTLQITGAVHLSWMYYAIPVDESFDAQVNFKVIAAQTNQTSQIPNTSFSRTPLLLSGGIAGAVIVAVALLVVYRKHSLKLRVEGENSKKET
ncbi:MAG: hypothetical protein NWF01_11405 [Candidatus Bathyarchaeota archaeon]|nr:hypothetical protein [Candidatus Bathyarchaeota archaeon]